MANQSSSKPLEIVDYIDSSMWPLDAAPQMLDEQWIQDLSKSDSFNDPYAITDLSSIFPPTLSFPTGDAAINTIDPYALHQTQLPIPLEASPPTFSTSSASPADSHSNHSPLGATEDPAFDPASESSSEEDVDDFAPVRKAPSGKVKGGARGKRAATKAKPYPRVSDVVRDAPHKNELGLSGGKKGPATTELKGSIRTADADDDDWRPTLEEYQKMSSREKRQLRNKISARNFRVRRKEYIATLEGEVATRDKQIEVYREELNTTKSENSELRKEIERLRQSILEGRGLAAAGDKSADSTVLSNANGKTLRSSRSVMPKTNRNKDLPANGSTRGFWGTPMSASTPVHTTLLPELDLVATLSGKQPKIPSPAPLQENINPLLNSMPAVKESQPTSPLTGFEGFADMNSFTYKTLEAYRMQLWQKMAREAGAANRGLPSPSSPPVSLAAANAAVGPRYFNSPSSKPIKTEEGSPTPIQSAVASTLTQGIVNKLGSAFWDAFSGSKPAPINNGPIKGFASQASTSTVDVEKVRRVLEGKAVLRVVDVDKDMQALEDGMKAVSLIAARQTPQMKPVKLESLEDNMKNMSLNRQTKNCVPTAAFGIFTQPLRTGHAPGSITPAHVSHAVAAQH